VRVQVHAVDDDGVLETTCTTKGRRV
jgi:hypothetical protein